ncbi:MAG TPA: putative metal-binding motif-containing protein [Candidatus Polarisedimenticolia bacterium]|nr:putative metal-binding motif-containing protein [Candidatus Polarisedimenticolia bacterium]
MLSGRRLLCRSRTVTVAALALSWLAATGPARAACPVQSQPITHLFDTWFNNCYDGLPVGFFTGLIADPTGVNNNGQDGVCESGPPAVNGIGQSCDPGAGIIGDGQVVVRYDFGAFNQGSLGCPNPLGGPQGGSPIVVMLVTPTGGFALLRTGYDTNSAGYVVDYAFPLNEAGDQPLNGACSNSASVQITSVSGGEICGTVGLPTLQSDCNADTAGPIVGTCPGPAGNPAITPGRVFTRMAPCNTPPDIRVDSGWTPSAVPPNPTTGAFCVPRPVPGCGQCPYLAATYRFDGIEIPAVAGFVRISGLPVCIDGDHDGYDNCSDCDDCNTSIHPGALEVCNSVDDNCNNAIDEGLGTQTCGVGACVRTVAACVGGLPPACVPGAPSPEICDGIDNDCNGTSDDLNGQVDPDGDGIVSACDNCPLVANANQSDIDADRQGDECDLDDGLILVDVEDGSHVTWQGETAFTTFNLYRGDLAVLKAGGGYTQDPALVPLAAKTCGVAGTDAVDPVVLQPGQAVFYLVTGNGAAGESSLGTDSNGTPRANTHPCP